MFIHTKCNMHYLIKKIVICIVGWFCKQRLVMCLRMVLQTKISDVSDQWSLPTDVQYVNRQIAYAWHPARPTCGRKSTKCWVLRSTPTNHSQVSDFFCRITLLLLLTDHPFPCVCICHERSGDAYLNTCIIHRAQSSACHCKVLHIRQRRSNCKEWWYGSSSIVG